MCDVAHAQTKLDLVFVVNCVCVFNFVCVLDPNRKENFREAYPLTFGHKLIIEIHNIIRITNTFSNESIDVNHLSIDNIYLSYLEKFNEDISKLQIRLNMNQ